MNASRRSVILAEGVLLYARHMDCPSATSPYTAKWAEWSKANGTYMTEAVIKAQTSLFDAALYVGSKAGYSN